MEHVYLTYHRNQIQYLPECAEYDPDLSYKLKTGTCQFSNIEFSTTVTGNSYGLRDDEASLIEPEIICLGDSYTMGWGVEGEQTFAQLIEKETKMKTLNAGMSSFGTPREMILLGKLDISKLKYLVIQYHPNDDYENQVFVENNNFLPIQSKKQFDHNCEKHINRRRYVPLRYFSNFLHQRWLYPESSTMFVNLGIAAGSVSDTPGAISSKATDSFAESKDLDKTEQSAFNFLEIIKSHDELSQVNLIILIITWSTDLTIDFKERIKSLTKQYEYPDFINSATVVNPWKFMNNQDYFYLDDHLNTKGHRKIGSALSEIINEQKSKNEVE